MWSYVGREFPAPTWDLGMAPAGSLYSSVNDQARFLKFLFAGGKTAMILNISVYSNFMKAPFEWDIQHLPKRSAGKQITRNASAGHSIASATKGPDAAWDFVSFPLPDGRQELLMVAARRQLSVRAH